MAEVIIDIIVPFAYPQISIILTQKLQDRQTDYNNNDHMPGDRIMFNASPGVRRLVACATLIAAIGDAVAQMPEQNSSAENSSSTTVVYPAEFFSTYEPVTVADMIRYIPGVALALESGSSTNPRGLGADEQILINSRRVSGRGNSALEQLRRIAYGQVSHIEIIRSTSSELGVASSGQIINIVTVDSGQQSVFFESRLTRYQDARLRPSAAVAVNGQRRGLEYRLSIEDLSAYQTLKSRELSLHGVGSFQPNDRIDILQVTDQRNRNISANTSYAMNARNEFSLNLQYRQSDPPSKIWREFEDFNVSPSARRQEAETIGSQRSSWEIGADHEFRFLNSGRLETLFIINQETLDSDRNRFAGLLTAQQSVLNLRLQTATINAEQIFRTLYSKPIAVDHDLDFGLERARTTLDSRLQLATAAPGGSGVLVPVRVPNANSSVEEIRYEGFMVHRWAMTPRMDLESTLVYESSTISQTGDIRRSRSFDFVRPKFDYRFNVTPAIQLRLSAERFIAQLRFADFSAARESRDDERNIVAGNPDLVQEKSWRYAINAEYRLPADKGVVNARAFYWDIQDVIARIDVSEPGGPLQSANGNIGNGNVYGLQLTASYRLSADLLATSSVLVRATSVIDPFTQRARRIPPNDRGFFSVGLRHTLPAWRINYGFDYREGFQGNRTLYDIDKIDDIDQEEDLTVFVERTSWTRLGLALRLEAINLLDDRPCNNRLRFAGGTASGIINEIEWRCTRRGPQIAVGVRGRF
jgi:outer membrane receptor for ferrienterochelin and colicins